MDSKEIKQVRNLLKQGLGRRRIAQILDCTEWAARKLIEDAVSEPVRTDAGPSNKPKIEVGNEALKLKGQIRTIGKTTIRLSGSAGSNPILHKAIERKVSTRVAVLSDIHYPFEDEKAVRIVDAFLLDYQPDVVVYNGDVADCYNVSSYQKAPGKASTIQQELDYTRLKLEERKAALPNVKEWYYLEGNHENRFKRLIAKDAPALAGLKGCSFHEAMALDELDITWVPDHEELWIGSLLFTHGHMARKHAGSSARGHFEKYGCSVLIGHVHRLSVAYRRTKSGNHCLIENGTLCDLDVEYAKFPDWQQGFTTLEFDGDYFAVTPRPIDNYTLIADGKVYGV
jgi:predicted phosphodiesterase